MIKKKYLIIPLLIYSLAIFIMSHQSQVPFIKNTIIGTDKVLHFFAYFVYGICSYIFFLALNNLNNSKKSKFFAILLALLFAISDEIHQSFIYGREADIFDFLADALGVIFSLLFFNIIFRVLKKRINEKQISTDK